MTAGVRCMVMRGGRWLTFTDKSYDLVCTPFFLYVYEPAATASSCATRAPAWSWHRTPSPQR